jgi:acetyl esterase/lipase
MLTRVALRHLRSAYVLGCWLVASASNSLEAHAAPGDPPPELRLWPGSAPGSGQLDLTETITNRSADPSRPDRAVSGVLHPTLSVFAPEHPSGVGLIIAPGGGYIREAIDKEGFEIASLLAGRGVTAFVLKYRLPAEGHAQRADVPLQDAQRAMRLVRARAAEFGVDSARIGCLGFSAGGHVAASLATRSGAKVYEPLDAIDSESARPDFSILLYPVISMVGGLAHAGSRNALLGPTPTELEVVTYSADHNVTSSTPPTLLILADDDATVAPENSLQYYRALHQAGVSAELHVFAAGRHGFGTHGAEGLPVGDWPNIASTWLMAAGILPAAVP